MCFVYIGFASCFAHTFFSVTFFFHNYLWFLLIVYFPCFYFLSFVGRLHYSGSPHSTTMANTQLNGILSVSVMCANTNESMMLPCIGIKSVFLFFLTSNPLLVFFSYLFLYLFAKKENGVRKKN